MSIQETAWQLMIDAEWDLGRAKRLWRDRRAWLDTLLAGSAELFSDLVPIAADAAIDAALDGIWRSDRPALRAGGDVPSHRPASVTSMPERRTLQKGEMAPMRPALQQGFQQAMAELTGLLAFPLTEDGEGKLLGLCTKSDLERYATRDIARGRTMMETGWWYRQIASMLKRPTDVVREHLTNADLERLLRQVQGKTA